MPSQAAPERPRLRGVSLYSLSRSPVSFFPRKKTIPKRVDNFDKVQFTRDYTGQVSDGRRNAHQIFHVMFKLSLVAAMVVIIKSTTRRLSSKDTLSQVSR